MPLAEEEPGEAELLLRPSAGQRRQLGDLPTRRRLVAGVLLLASVGLVFVGPLLVSDAQALKPRTSGSPARTEGLFGLPTPTLSPLPGSEAGTLPPTPLSSSPGVQVGTLPPLPVSSLPGLQVGSLPPLPHLLEVPPAVNPYKVGATVGRNWSSFATSEEAFKFLDKDGDGFLTYKGDHIQRLENITVPVPKGVFEMHFRTEKLRLVSSQNVREPHAMDAWVRYQALLAGQLSSTKVKDDEPRKMVLTVGEAAKIQRRVDELYTFGAPATAPVYLYDATRPQGCFLGLRTFSHGERYTNTFGSFFSINDPVSWITSFLNYDHAKMESMEANENNDLDNTFHPCNFTFESVVMQPSKDDFFWFNGHLIYEDVLRAHANALGVTLQSLPASTAASTVEREKVARAYLMSHFAFFNYHAHAQLLHIDAKDIGWTLVGRSCSTRQGGWWAPRCKDHVSLWQNDKNLECAFAFEGSDDMLDWIADLDVFVDDFCGFGHVHRGFKMKLMKMIQSIDFRQSVLAKLPSCARVTVLGHSLGGAQAELFTACANKGVKEGEDGYEDYRLITWEKGTPARMAGLFDEQVKGGTFLQNKGNSFCLDIRGTMETKYEEDLMVYTCEFPGSQYSHDQQWTFQPNGSMVNGLTGLCMTALDSHNNSVLTQFPCGQANISKYQAFELTPEKFLKSKSTGECVDSTLAMVTCPYTDQKWRFTTDGKLQNVLSGQCLDVAGGSRLMLWACSTAQTWKLTPEGVLQNTASSMCVNFRSEQGKEVNPDLVMAACSSTGLQWQSLEGGFLRTVKTGKCLDAAGAPGTDNGTSVALYTCEDKYLPATGQWVHTPNGFLRNVGPAYEAQQRCVEVFGAYGTNEKLKVGARLHLTGCELSTDQRWELTSEGYIRSVLGARKCLDVTPNSLHGELWLNNCLEPTDPNIYQDWKWRLTTAGFIQNVESLECLSAHPFKGRMVHITQCNASAEQLWQQLPDGFIQQKATGLCLDVIGSPGLADGLPLALWECERGSNAVAVATDQQWIFAPGGFLKNSLSAKCIQQSGGVPKLEPCPEPPKGQQWSLVPAGAGNLIRNRWTGKCVDVQRNETQGSAPRWRLLSWDCDASRALQQWETVAA